MEYWDGQKMGIWATQLQDADVVVNLAGEGIADRLWNGQRKLLIQSSRIGPTRALVSAIARSMNRPKILVSASAVGFYGPVAEREVTEIYPRGEGFLPDLCAEWEAEAKKAQALGVRVVLLRTGIVIEKDGGALGKLMMPFWFFMGGPLGSGRQWFPWVHRDDVVGAIFYAIQNETLSGPVNIAAPGSLTMAEFCRLLGKAMRRPSWARVPAFVLRSLLGEMSEILLTGQKAVPRKLLEAGYTFQYPHAEEALASLFRK